MKMRLVSLCLVAGTTAFAQAPINGQFTERAPLFPPSPIVGTDPVPLTNWGRTNIFLTNTAPVFSNQFNRGFTNASVPANFGAQRWVTNAAGQLVPAGPSAQYPQLPRTGPGTFPVVPGNQPNQPVQPIQPVQSIQPTQPVPPNQPVQPVLTNQPVPPAVPPGTPPALPGQQPLPDLNPPSNIPPNAPPKIPLRPAAPLRAPRQ